MDEDGFIYFIGRRDEMIKTSGYRVSPTEIEEAIYGTQLVGEVAAFGVPHPSLGQGIVVVATPASSTAVDEAMLISVCRTKLPAFMVPAKIEIRPGPLPRNPNGKIDRKAISIEFHELFSPKDAATLMEKSR
jgi:acyl-CoA synthetase (AMP-forming)/AMP-acid ligase II